MHLRRSTAGFTMIELLITIAIGAILVSLVAPNFRGYLAKKRVEGVLTELATDIQLARSEAVSRNTTVRMTLGTNCYMIHPVAASAVASSCTVTSGTNIRTVVLENASTVNLSAAGGLTSIDFDSIRGTATLNGVTTDEGSIDVKTPAGASPAFQLRAVVSKYGRVRVCTTNGMAGYSACT